MNPIIVAASGHSLTPEIAGACQNVRVIAVNDAWQLFPWAETLYAADVDWWQHHNGVPQFAGEKLTVSYNQRKDTMKHRSRLLKRLGIRTLWGRRGAGFSFEEGVIHFGSNSAFQAAQIALQRGASPLIFVGLDLHGNHFFGDHPKALRRTRSFNGFIDRFQMAAKMHPDLWIINATPGSSLNAFPIMTIEEALNASRKT